MKFTGRLSLRTRSFSTSLPPELVIDTHVCHDRGCSGDGLAYGAAAFATPVAVTIVHACNRGRYGVTVLSIDDSGARVVHRGRGIVDDDCVGVRFVVPVGDSWNRPCRHQNHHWAARG